MRAGQSWWVSSVTTLRLITGRQVTEADETVVDTDWLPNKLVERAGSSQVLLVMSPVSAQCYITLSKGGPQIQGFMPCSSDRQWGKGWLLQECM